jgi:uncharacterized protein (DUF1778 family)
MNRSAAESLEDTRQVVAKIAVEKTDRLQLSVRDSLWVLDMLESPPAPNARLLAAAQTFPAIS